MKKYVYLSFYRRYYSFVIHTIFSYTILLQIKQFEKQECPEERRKIAREIYDNFIMKELLSHAHVRVFVNCVE